MRIIHLASGDLWAGAEVHLYYIASALRKNDDITLQVILLNDGELANRLRLSGVDIVVIPEKEISSIKIFFRLIKLFRKFKPHIVHTHRVKENVLGSFANYFSGRAKSLRTVHGAPESSPSMWNVHKHLFVLLDYYCGKYLQQKIIAVSNELKSILVRRYGEKNIVVVENGVDIDEIKRKALANRVSFIKNENRSTIGFFGRFVSIKRIDIIIDVATVLNKISPGEFDFYLFGDGPLKHELEKKARIVGAAGFVNFMGFTNEVYPYLHQLDAVIITSDHEGLPMIVLEAMALDVLVLSRAVGGIPEVIAKGAGGVLFSSENAPDIAREVSEIMKSPSEVNARVRYARNTLTSIYAMPVVVGRLIALYKKL